jgi:hypothetical protein
MGDGVEPLGDVGLGGPAGELGDGQVVLAGGFEQRVVGLEIRLDDGVVVERAWPGDAVV